MAKGYNPTEYIYSSARIRALENKLATRERLWHMADADSADAVISGLGDFGFESVRAGVPMKRDDVLESVLIEGYAEIESMECARAVDFMRYQYDANNIKAIIKCAFRGISPDPMLSALGTVDLQSTRAAFEEKDYSAFPANIQRAASEAEEAFAVTSDPQKIDFILDKACFADMLAAVDRSGIELAKRLVRVKIDTVNLMTTLRMLRMRLGKTAAGILRDAYIAGGRFSVGELLDALDSDESELSRLAAVGGYGTIATAIFEGEALGAVERIADDVWFGVAKEARCISFGAEIAIGYMAALEYEVKNIRIILAGKDASLTADVIRERLRDCYV